MVKEKLVSYPWWMVLLQGIVALVLGGILLAAPAMSTALLIRILGLYWLIDGIFSLVRIFLKNSKLPEKTDIFWERIISAEIF